ncbi:MAG: radical SAM protein [Bacteroidales bacterium]|nr:radical SAM protein [Bacteroidales bacterium]MDY0141490.1 radical SAM protein [Bacteroidales bacterium]
MTDCLFITSSKARAIQFSVYPYLGVGYLANLLKADNISSRLYDADINKSRIGKLLKDIEKNEPLVIAYSIMSISLPFFYKITTAIKENFPKIIIVAGGPHVTSDPGIIKEMGIDYGFSGHSEESFPAFMSKIKNGDFDFSTIKGMIIPAQNRYDEPVLFDVSQTDLIPDYSLYNLDKYQNIFYGRKWFTMITTRGCAYNCKFCKDPGKNRYKEYPIETIKQQLLFLVREKSLSWISFVDDTFTYNRDRVIELCDWIIAEDLKFKWTCCTRADTLDEELIKKMSSAGFHYAIIGVEAGNEEIRQGINKNISSAEYVRIINILRANKVRVLCSYVLGNPNESYSQIEETISFSNKLNANYAQYYNMTALPQSPIFKYGIDEKVFGENIWTKYMKGESGLPYYVPEGLELTKLKRLKTKAFIKYYLRPTKFFDLGTRLIKFFVDVRIRN